MALELIKQQTGSSVTALAVENCFTADYDVYILQVAKGDFASNAYIWARFIDSGGSVITDSEYAYGSLDMYSNTGFAELKSTSVTAIPGFGLSTAGSADFGGITMYIFNPYASKYTFMTVQSSSKSTNLIGNKIMGAHKSQEQLSGIQLNRSAGDSFDMTINMYGVKP